MADAPLGRGCLRKKCFFLNEDCACHIASCLVIPLAKTVLIPVTEMSEHMVFMYTNKNKILKREKKKKILNPNGKLKSTETQLVSPSRNVPPDF